VLWVSLAQLKDRWGALLVVASGAVGAGIGIAWLAWSVGGLRVVGAILPTLMRANSQNPYAVEYQSGPGYLLLMGFFVLMPVATAFCPLGLSVAFFSRRHFKYSWSETVSADWEVIRWVRLLLAAFLVVPMLLSHWLNLRYLSPISGPLCLLAGLGVWYAGWVAADRKSAVVAAALLLSFAAGLTWTTRADYRRFQTMFVRNEIGDLSIKLLLDPKSRAELPH
jgi:hypothetical protein